MEKGGITHCQHRSECKSMRRAVRWVCLHPMCNNFLELCESCHEIHAAFHEANRLEHEADWSTSIVSLDTQKEIVDKMLNKVMSELYVIQEKILAEIRSLTTKESQSEQLINELI